MAETHEFTTKKGGKISVMVTGKENAVAVARSCFPCGGHQGGTPSGGLSREEIKAMIDEATGKIVPGLSAESVQEMIDEATGTIVPGLSAEDVLAMIDEALETAAPGVSLEDVQRLIDQAAAGASPSAYSLCEFYYFRNPKLRPGFEAAEGGLIENAADLYPKAWAFLQTEEGQALCVTEEEWQAMRETSWATLEDGTKIGWNGLGGAPFFAPDLETGALRLPDIRGMYAEAAGFDSLEVGSTHGDAIRNIAGRLGHIEYLQPDGPFVTTSTENVMGIRSANKSVQPATFLDASRVVPTANKNQPRAWGALACVYLGTQE